MRLIVDSKAIRLRMAELNLNQSELAKAAKLNRGTVILAMRGGDVHLSTVAAIAQALECSPLDLLQEV